MSVPEEDEDEIELGNGDALAERLGALDLDEDETCSPGKLRERLDR